MCSRKNAIPLPETISHCSNTSNNKQKLHELPHLLNPLCFTNINLVSQVTKHFDKAIFTLQRFRTLNCLPSLRSIRVWQKEGY